MAEPSIVLTDSLLYTCFNLIFILCPIACININPHGGRVQKKRLKN